MSSNPETQETKPEAKRKSCCGPKCWKIPFVIIGIVAIKSVLVMLLWNALIPDLFHGPLVTYCQAIGLVLLSKLLVCGGGPFRHGGPGRFGPPWRRWEGLTPEQREKLRQEIKGCCE